MKSTQLTEDHQKESNEFFTSYLTKFGQKTKFMLFFPTLSFLTRKADLLPNIFALNTLFFLYISNSGQASVQKVAYFSRFSRLKIAKWLLSSLTK